MKTTTVNGMYRFYRLCRIDLWHLYTLILWLSFGKGQINNPCFGKCSHCIYVYFSLRHLVRTFWLATGFLPESGRQWNANRRNASKKRSDWSLKGHRAPMELSTGDLCSCDCDRRSDWFPDNLDTNQIDCNIRERTMTERSWNILFILSLVLESDSRKM